MLRTVGIEEEFLIVDPSSGRARAMASAVLQADQRGSDDELEGELQLQQVETGTRPCTSMDELHDEVRSARLRASDAARSIGTEIAALGTSPLAVQAKIAPSRRYQRMAQRFGLTVHEQLTCGCHVHVGVHSDEEAVAVIDRIRPWLAPLLALSANSPYWQGADSQYASYRQQIWSRWPSANATHTFGSAKAYHDTVRAMIDTGTVLDSGMIYFDARLSRRYPTVEIRVCDVCLYAQDAVLMAMLVRALVDTAARDWAAGRAAQSVRVELLNLASWQAARFGLDGELLDPHTLRPASARTVLNMLLEHVEEALRRAGDYASAATMIGSVFDRGNGAHSQRGAHSRTGSLSDVVVDAVRRTRDV